MNLDQIRYFVATVDSKSINKAAQNLYISQSALSKSLKALENELNFPILVRSKSGIIATEPGLTIYQEAKQILKMTDRWFTLGEKENTFSGHIHLLSTDTTNISFLEEMFVNIQAQNPDFSLHIHNERPDEFLNHLRRKSFRIALGCFCVDKMDSIISLAQKNHYAMEKILDDSLHAIVNVQNPLARKEVLSIADLLLSAIATYTDPTSPIDEYFIAKFPFANVLHFSSKERIINAVLHNNAITFYPLETVKNEYLFTNKKIKAIPLKDYTVSVAHYLFYLPENLEPHPSEQALIKKIRHAYRHLQT